MPAITATTALIAGAIVKKAVTPSARKITAQGGEPVRQFIDTKWFKSLLADKQIKQRALAENLGLDPAAISLMLRGQRRLQLDEAAQIANLLGVPLDEVLSHAGVDPDVGTAGTVPIVGWMDSDGEIHMRRPDGPRRAQAPAGLPEDTVALRYQTDDATDGYIAFYSPRNDIDPDAVGRVCVVQVAPAGKGPRYVRVLKRGYQRGTFTLSRVRDRGQAVENVEIASASPVLWIKMV